MAENFIRFKQFIFDEYALYEKYKNCLVYNAKHRLFDNNTEEKKDEKNENNIQQQNIFLPNLSSMIDANQYTIPLFGSCS
jgi:hypothetical protein